MSDIGDALTAIAAQLTAAGIPTTVDPGIFPQLVAQNGAAALVEAPTPTGRLLPGRVDLSIPVWLCGATNDLAGMEAVFAQVPTLIAALTPVGANPPGAWRSGDIALPGYEFTITRRLIPN
jgi:hypothetical protein